MWNTIRGLTRPQSSRNARREQGVRLGFRLEFKVGVRRDRERRLGTSQILGVFIDHKNCRLNSLERLEVNQLAIYKHGQRVELRT